MKATDQPNAVQLPEGLRGQFTGLNRGLWKVESLAALGWGGVSLLLSCLALFVSDRFWDTPVGLRVACTFLGWAGLAWCGIRWAKLWVFRPRDRRALAVLVQKQYRRLGDRLLGIVELADEKQRPAGFSPALYRAAISQVATEASQFDFMGAVDPRPARAARWALLGLGLVALSCVGLSPSASWNVVRRWSSPMAAIPRFTLVVLDGLPAQQVVAHGEPFVVTCSVRYRSFWQPGRAVCQIERQPRLVTPTQDRKIQVRLPGQVQQGLLRLRLGDARAQVRIVPTYRPSLRALSATVEWPAYLQHPPATESVENGYLSVLEGSRVAFSGTLSRTAAEAQVQVAGQSPQPLHVTEERFSSEAMDLEGVGEVVFTWRDPFGLDGAAPWRLQIQPRKDSPPTPELVDLLKDSAILESEVLEIKMLGRDDFGVREVGMEWQLLNDAPGTTNPPPRPYVYRASSPNEKKLEDTFYFSPSLLMVPPDSIVEVRGFANDFYPERPRSQTPVYRIHVLGNERHAELVRQNLESLLTRLEEVTRLEEKVAASTRTLQDLPKEKLAADQAGDQIGEAKQEQLQNAGDLAGLSSEGQKTLREAARNPTFNEETLRDWAKTLQQMQQLSEGKMQQAAHALSAAQQDPDTRPENLARAAQREQEILEALEQMQRQVNKGLDQLQALTLAQRLRKIGADEKEIADGLQRIIPEAIGLFPKELPVRIRDTESFLAGEQASAQQETEVLQGEIGRFFERTQKENYGQVSKEMNEARILEELERLRGLIEENVAMDAMQSLGSWADRLKAWADLLEPPSDSSSGGGEGGGGGGVNDEALLRTLIGLLRVRDREINLRQRTGLLDRNQAAQDVYREGAKSLAAAQGQIQQDLHKLQTENPVPAIEFPLQQTAESMESVRNLLDKPQTDRQTQTVQTETIEHLSDAINLINEQQQRRNNRNSSQASAEEMAFLMQMMALQASGRSMNANPAGGGSQAGGTTDRAATPMPGDSSGQRGEERTVRRASGAVENLPTEFREALEDYFRGVEQLEGRP